MSALRKKRAPGRVRRTAERRGERRRRDEGLPAPERKGHLAEEGQGLDERPEARVVDERDGEQGRGPALLDPLVHVLDVEPSPAHGHHRAELARVADAHQELGAEADVVESDLLADEDAADGIRDGLPGGPFRLAGALEPLRPFQEPPGHICQHLRAGRVDGPGLRLRETHAAHVRLVEDERRDDLQNDRARAEGGEVRLPDLAALGHKEVLRRGQPGPPEELIDLMLEKERAPVLLGVLEDPGDRGHVHGPVPFPGFPAGCQDAAAAARPRSKALRFA